jgi:AraC-like DNA-binding protein
VTNAAYSFVGDFDPAPPQRFCVDRHYLLYAVRGAMRLEYDATTWTLPPARAALIRAGEPIEVTITHPMTTASMLFDTGFVDAPSSALTVIDMTPLARALVAECSQWIDEQAPLGDYAVVMFRALAAAAWALAEHPSRTHMPTGRSAEVRRALEITALQMADQPRFDAIAADVGLAPRSLARRFEQELGMTWRGALRRLRVLRSIELLAGTQTTVTAIAMDIGYSSLSAFESAFADLVGKTPTEYRSGFDP